MAYAPDDAEHVALTELHAEAGAKMVPFAGYLMPLQYEGIKSEHLAVRRGVGLFDVSHMGEIEVRGEGAVAIVDALVANDVTRLVDGQALYTVMCHEHGGIIDDLLVYRLSATHLMLCVNAANRAKDAAHIKAYALPGAEIEDVGDAWSQLALQGPQAAALLGELTELKLGELKTYHAVFAPVAGQPDVLISRTGYTGEDGFELYMRNAQAEPIFEALRERGQAFEMALCGLGARDTLRLEAKFPLYGQDLTDETNPLEAGLGWTVKLDTASDFIGKEALIRIKQEGVKRGLRGFVIKDKGVIRPGCPIFSPQQDHDAPPIGRITSGSFSYMLDTSVGMGYVERDHLERDTVDVQVRSKRLEAEMTKKAFYKKSPV